MSSKKLTSGIRNMPRQTSQVRYKAVIPQSEARNQVLLKAWDFCFDCWKHNSACLCNEPVSWNRKDIIE